MKTIFIALQKIKNLLPYFLLISVYFFFINLEARKDKNYNRDLEKEYKIPSNKNTQDDNQMRISIPVIPYKE